MKKYLNLTGYIALYIVILVILNGSAFYILNNGAAPTKFLNDNSNLVIAFAFLLTLIIYGIIFRLRKMSLIKTCNFSKLSLKNIARVVSIGIVMGIFTSCLCNTTFVINNLKELRYYVPNFESGSSSLIFYILAVVIMFSFEEMIFRGVIFNEFRGVISLYKALVCAALIYGLINTGLLGFEVGIFAFTAVIFYTLAYVYLRSLWASIIIQITTMFTLSLLKYHHLWTWLKKSGDPVVAPILVIAVAALLTLYYFMYKNYKATETTHEVSFLS